MPPLCPNGKPGRLNVSTTSRKVILNHALPRTCRHRARNARLISGLWYFQGDFLALCARARLVLPQEPAVSWPSSLGIPRRAGAVRLGRSAGLRVSAASGGPVLTAGLVPGGIVSQRFDQGDHTAPGFWCHLVDARDQEIQAPGERVDGQAAAAGDLAVGPAPLERPVQDQPLKRVQAPPSNLTSLPSGGAGSPLPLGVDGLKNRIVRLPPYNTYVIIVH